MRAAFVGTATESNACPMPAARRACTLSLTWAAFESFDVDEWTATLRHELVHVEQFQRYGTTDHGPAFRERAAAVDATVRCPLFVDPTYVLTCADCGAVVARRYRERPLVRDHEAYRSSCCGAAVACSGPDSG